MFSLGHILSFFSWYVFSFGGTLCWLAFKGRWTKDTTICVPWVFVYNCIYIYTYIYDYICLYMFIMIIIIIIIIIILCFCWGGGGAGGGGGNRVTFCVLFLRGGMTKDTGVSTVCGAFPWLKSLSSQCLDRVVSPFFPVFWFSSFSARGAQKKQSPWLKCVCVCVLFFAGSFFGAPRKAAPAFSFLQSPCPE